MPGNHSEGVGVAFPCFLDVWVAFLAKGAFLEVQVQFKTAACFYLTQWTRPDIAYAVSQECRFMHNPGPTHEKALKRTLRYLQDTPDMGLLFDFSAKPAKTGVYGYYDAAHADCLDTLRSTLAYVFYL